MSDILIRMEMPRNCFQCPLSVLKGKRLFCEVTKEEVLRAKLAPECPLHELPPHGDLIDVSKIVLEYGGLAKISPYDFVGIAKYFAEQLKKQPVIVPAERREE